MKIRVLKIFLFSFVAAGLFKPADALPGGKVRQNWFCVRSL